MATTQPIRDKKQTKALAKYFLDKGEIRNYVMVVFAMHTGLRISDILRLTWDDVYDFELNEIRDFVIITEKKTGKSKTIRFGEKVLKSLRLYAHNARQGCFLIGNSQTSKAISRIQAYRIIRKAAETLKFTIRVSCHSLRKTFGYHAWKGGASPVVIMEIFNHSSFDVTKRYIGISQDDKDIVYLTVKLVA